MQRGRVRISREKTKFKKNIIFDYWPMALQFSLSITYSFNLEWEQSRSIVSHFDYLILLDNNEQMRINFQVKSFAKPTAIIVHINWIARTRPQLITEVKSFSNQCFLRFHCRFLLLRRLLLSLICFYLLRV